MLPLSTRYATVSVGVTGAGLRWLPNASKSSIVPELDDLSDDGVTLEPNATKSRLYFSANGVKSFVRWL